MGTASGIGGASVLLRHRRAQAQGVERNLSGKDRQKLSPTRVGALTCGARLGCRRELTYRGEGPIGFGVDGDAASPDFMSTRDQPAGQEREAF